ncbi:hypothetical protein CEUSTIGMA_g1177.t1 [Chlamydomonas eustigma]|uniref:Tubulin--tyrosine ligase-like protein 5 n=1 Tax=Chlamydomonas eustigma TaxID=1157962 RepID=A0A250WSC1_9CHLO|nr:hypothetical protein CEUSTIGMA_g1177.t1 [Chlamydomonas eustigma]|eukprot:GAX73724.1 hypothetical protein CEUSTIGMA_g1177.t1 [Chlamydomonas eustigma]
MHVTKSYTESICDGIHCGVVATAKNASSSQQSINFTPLAISHLKGVKNECKHMSLLPYHRFPPSWSNHLLPLCPVPLLTLCRVPSARASGVDVPFKFRFWIDYQVLSSPASAELIERALLLAGGRKTGGPPKLDAVTAAKVKLKDYGYMHMDAWDLLWTITAKAMLAAEILRPGQMVSIVPGFLSITRKTSLVRSLRSVYGDEVAFSIVPRTFKLPDELDEWEMWIHRHRHDKDSGLWMLKNNKQRGTGLRLVKTDEAFEACFETTSRPGLEGMVLYRWYLAQQYIKDPLLIDGLKSGLRVWVFVPDTKPLRVYLHCNGLVLFSHDRYDAADTNCEAGSLPAGHITNYAQNENGRVWNLHQLRAHLGGKAFAKVWAQVERSVAQTFVAALPRCKEVQAEMALPARSCFQFFGLDFLIDSSLTPCHALTSSLTPP